MTARKYLYLFCYLLFAPVTARLHAQVLYGSIVGTVTDPSAAVIANAQIKAVNPATGETRETTTDDAGHFTLSNLIPGSSTGFSCSFEPSRITPPTRRILPIRRRTFHPATSS